MLLEPLILGAWLVPRVNSQNTPSDSNAIADALVGWVAGPDTRGTSTLVWSCVITIFTCTWAVLHLNVPHLKDTPRHVLTRKIKWMVINVLFPELILSKAVCDLRLALDELREFDENLAKIGPITWITKGGWKAEHEWCWKVKYPKHSGMLYRLLGLKPPCGRSSSGSMAHQNTEVSNDGGIRMDAVQASEVSHGGRLSNGTEPGQDEEASTGGRAHSSHNIFMDRRRRKPPSTTQEWTAVHSYYAQMGGLVYDVLRGFFVVLTATNLASRGFWDPDKHPLKHLILGEKDIQDKSKADWLVKGIAILQITWIVLSVIVRRTYGLPITQLEIATIAFSVMAVLIYLANWWKPKDVSRPTILPQPVELFAERRVAAGRMQPLWLRLRSPAKAIEKMVGNLKWDRVPNDLVCMEGDTPLIFVMMGVSSLVFGGLHCLAWNFEFPTRVELVCWRAASLISAVLPMLALGINLIITHLSNRTQSRLVSALRKKLQTLDSCLPLEWWEYMVDTAHGTQHWKERWSAHEAIAGAESESRERGSNLEEDDLIALRHLQLLARRMKETLEADKDFFGTLYNDLGYQWLKLSGAWHEVKATGGKHSATDRSRCVFCQKNEHSRRSSRLHLWRDYEAFIRHELRMPAPRPPWASHGEQFLQAFAESFDKDLTRSEEELLRAYTLASTFVTISSGVIYTAARLVIITLLFTCLRATPAGAYQLVPWLKFIPILS